MSKVFSELSPYKIVKHDWKNPYPVHVEIDPTSRCNQDCIRCSYKQDIDGSRDYIIQHQGKELEYERFQRLIGEFQDIGIKAITLSGGGEPLFYSKIEEIVQDIYDAKIKLGIITNLALRRDMELLSRAVWIRVSLDAGSKESYTTLHRPANPNAYDVVLENIKALRKANANLDLGINFLIQPENYYEVYETACQMKELGASYIRFVPAIATSAIDYQDIFKKIEHSLEKSLSLIDDNFQIFVNKARFDSLADKRKNYNFCHKQRIHPLIGADGNLYPCCLLKYYKKHVLGSILNDDLKTVWNGKQRAEWLANLDVQQCPTCWFDRTNEFMEYLTNENPKHLEFV